MFENKDNSELESNILFSGVKQELAARYANPKNIIGKREGDVIFQKGDSCDYFYLLIEGIIKLKQTKPDGSNIYIEKGKNSFFGETELLAKTSRKTSAVAETDCRMYTFNYSELKSLIKESGKVLRNLQENLTFRITDDDFYDYTKEFEIKAEDNLEFPKTTEKITLKDLEDTDEGQNTSEPENNTNDGETTPAIEQTDEQTDNLSYQILDDAVEEPEEAVLSPDENKPDTEDFFADGDIANEESNDYFRISDPAEIENNPGDIEFQQEEEYKPSFTDIGFDEIDDTIEEVPEPEDEPQPEEQPLIEKELETDYEPLSFEEEQPPEKQQENGEGTYTETDGEIPEPEVQAEPEQSAYEEYTEPPTAETTTLSNDKTSAFYKNIIKKIQNIFSSVNLDEVINIISEEAADLVGAEGSVLYIIDSENEELVSKVLSGTLINDVRIKLSDGLQGMAAREKTSIFVDDPGKEKFFNPVIEDLMGIKIKNALYYPLIKSNNETAAVFELYNSQKGKFSQTDVEIIDEISASAIKAINNTKLTDIFLQQKRISSIADITGFINEDIRNPLLLIKHYASILRKKAPATEIKQILDLQLEQVNAIEDFINISKAYAKDENILELTTVKIGEALNPILGLLAEYVESRNTVIYRKTEADAVVRLDPGQLYQACYQIVKNACDEMAEDGKIYVTTEKDEEYIKIKFRDTGKGIPESWKEKIFRPFITRKKNKAGIGLTIAEKIISDHGGYIMVDSITGQGTTFIIALPIVF